MVVFMHQTEYVTDPFAQIRALFHNLYNSLLHKVKHALQSTNIAISINDLHMLLSPIGGDLKRTLLHFAHEIPAFCKPL